MQDRQFTDLMALSLLRMTSAAIGAGSFGSVSGPGSLQFQTCSLAPPLIDGMLYGTCLYKVKEGLRYRDHIEKLAIEAV